MSSAMVVSAQGERACRAYGCRRWNGEEAGRVARIEPYPCRSSDRDRWGIGNERIRLWGIDAPELEQQCERNGAVYACGEEARAALSRLVVNGQISCKTLDRDRYGRALARCSVNGEDLGAAMVGAGWAIDFERYSRGAYAVEEREARLAKRGLWAGEFDLASLWRRNH